MRKYKNKLHYIRNYKGVYPKELTQDFLDFSFILYQKEELKDEKRYLGKIIDIKDFKYKSNGQSYQFCISPNMGGYCWHGN